MKRFKVLGVGFLAVCALSLVALPVSAAWAKTKPVLQLNEGENAAANEAYTNLYAEFVNAECRTRNYGNLTGNDAATVKAVTTENQDECSEEAEEIGTSVEGSLEKAEITTTGKLTLTGSLTVTLKAGHPDGPCKYVFSKWKLTSKVPGPVGWGGKIKAKLDKTGSNKTKGACASTLEEEVNVHLVDQHAKAFEAALT